MWHDLDLTPTWNDSMEHKKGSGVKKSNGLFFKILREEN